MQALKCKLRKSPHKKERPLISKRGKRKVPPKDRKKKNKAQGKSQENRLPGWILTLNAVVVAVDDVTVPPANY